MHSRMETAAELAPETIVNVALPSLAAGTLPGGRARAILRAHRAKLARAIVRLTLACCRAWEASMQRRACALLRLHGHDELARRVEARARADRMR